MTSQEAALQQFADFAASLQGDEKGESQLFLIRLLEAFGHDGHGLPEGSRFEHRVRFPGDKTKYADFVWPGRVLLEMKSRGKKLSAHYQQTWDYWTQLVPHRPPYVVLCNFDELWIYDFNTQLSEPVDRLKISELPARHAALNFLFPRPFTPIFGNNWVEVTRRAADDVAGAFNSLVHRREPRDRARRFILQCVVAMFAEDIGLLPKSLFTGLLEECQRGASCYDLLGGLFRQMNDPHSARGGRYAGVDYFNGGLFAIVEPVELTPGELGLLLKAAKEDWSRVQPIIFGTLFEGSLDKDQRHALGAHFTYEADIQKIVRPTIVRPWDERIAAARTAKELRKLLTELRAFRVLDPACGSGNFLFVAYRALREIEQRILLKLFGLSRDAFRDIGLASGISPRNFFGLDVNDNAVETAKVTLMLARRLAHRDAEKFWAEHDEVVSGDLREMALQMEKYLPLDNLEDNIRCVDALFTRWPDVDAIIGNPPFLDARRVTMIHGAAYSKKIRAAFPDVPGRADFCVHWFRKAHEVLKPGCRAGLVGTNTVRQNYSREGGLDYVVRNSGVITEAVSTQVWSGESAVHVSIVNWLKLPAAPEKPPADFWLPREKKLYTQLGDNLDSKWKCEELTRISAALSAGLDVTSAKHLTATRTPKRCLEGQQPGHTGFVIKTPDLERLTETDDDWSEVVFPFLNGDDLISGTFNRDPSWLIDFEERDIFAAKKHKALFSHLEKSVLPTWQHGAEKEREKSGKTRGEHQDRLQTWWLLKRRRGELISALGKLSRYVVCSAVTKRQIFEFIDSGIRPSNALKAFLFEDDYSFGIISSGVHWAWFTARSSTLKGDFRYTPDTVFDTFPWPQWEAARQGREGRKGEGRKPSRPSRPLREPVECLRAVAEAGKALRRLRQEILDANEWSLRDLYKTLELPGHNRLRDAHAALDAAVRAAYGMTPDEDILAFLLALNLDCAAREARGEAITPPGLPAWVPEPQSFVSRDCVRAELPGGPADGSTAESWLRAAHDFTPVKEEAAPWPAKP